MKLAIVGSRSIEDYPLIREHLLEHIENVKEIVTGGSSGIDSLAEQFAQEFNIKIRIFLPKWEKYGKAAGIKRNEEIWQYADKGVAFWDGKSRGTANSFKLAKKYNKNLCIIQINVD